MPTVEYCGRKFEVNEGGFLIRWREDYSQAFITGVGLRLGIEEVTDEHLYVLSFVRRLFRNQGTPPSMEEIERVFPYGQEEILKLFPGGMKSICLMAGLPNANVSH